MKIILFDSMRRENFLPLTYLRSMAALRMGVLTIVEKWNLSITLSVSFVTPFYLQKNEVLFFNDQPLLFRLDKTETEKFIAGLPGIDTLKYTSTSTSSSFIFIKEGAVVGSAFLNSTQGVIYIGKGAEVMEDAVIRGSIAVCGHAVVKSGCRLLKACTISYGKKNGKIVK